MRTFLFISLIFALRLIVIGLLFKVNMLNSSLVSQMMFNKQLKLPVSMMVHLCVIVTFNVMKKVMLLVLVPR